MSDSLVRLIDLPVRSDPRGNLCFAESERHVPFGIERVYFLYDVPSGSVRAGHAHKELHEFLIPVSGSFDVKLYDGARTETVHMNRPYRGLHIGPMMWRDIDNFSAGSVCLVFSSMYFDEADYIRDFDAFEAAVAR